MAQDIDRKETAMNSSSTHIIYETVSKDKYGRTRRYCYSQNGLTAIITRMPKSSIERGGHAYHVADWGNPTTKVWAVNHLDRARQIANEIAAN